MKLQSYRRVSPRINLSALVDVLFILIIFVMLVASFDPARALDIALPTSQSEAALEPRAATLRVPSSGAMTLDGYAVEPGQLIERLRQARAERDTLVLVADGEIPLTRATELLSAANRAGFASVSIATRGAGDEGSP